MMESVADKRVAVVGRAEYLGAANRGADIDGSDFVIRVNWTLPIRPQMHPHVGERTDLLYTLQTLQWQQLHRKAAAQGVRAIKVNTELRDQLAQRVSVGGKYIPNSGTVAIFDALANGAAEVRAFGFTLHTDGRYVDTGEVHNRRDRWAVARAKDRRITHNPENDRQLLRHLLDTEPRFQPDEVLREILEAAPPRPTTAIMGSELAARWRTEAETLARYKDQRGADLCVMHAEELEKVLSESTRLP